MKKHYELTRFELKGLCLIDIMKPRPYGILGYLLKILTAPKIAPHQIRKYNPKSPSKSKSKHFEIIERLLQTSISYIFQQIIFLQYFTLLGDDLTMKSPYARLWNVA